MKRKFSELRAEMSPQSQARARQRAQAALLRLAFGELAEALVYIPMPGQKYEYDKEVRRMRLMPDQPKHPNHEACYRAMHQLHVAVHEAASALESVEAAPHQETET